MNGRMLVLRDPWSSRASTHVSPRGWRILPYKLQQTLNLYVHKLISVRSLRKTGLEQLKTKASLSKQRNTILEIANLEYSSSSDLKEELRLFNVIFSMRRFRK